MAIFVPYPVRSKADPSIIGVVLSDPTLNPWGYADAWKIKGSDEGYEGENTFGPFNHSYACWDKAEDNEAIELMCQFILSTVDEFMMHLQIADAMVERTFHQVQ
jgi:hypothetical protein